MGYRYYLPDENGVKKEYEADNNSIIIIGANGTGIGQQYYQYVNRIVA